MKKILCILLFLSATGLHASEQLYHMNEFTPGLYNQELEYLHDIKMDRALYEKTTAPVFSDVPLRSIMIYYNNGVANLYYRHGNNMYILGNSTSTSITDHTLLSNIGTNTHAQIDTALANALTVNTTATITSPWSFNKPVYVSTGLFVSGEITASGTLGIGRFYSGYITNAKAFIVLGVPSTRWCSQILIDDTNYNLQFKDYDNNKILMRLAGASSGLTSILNANDAKVLEWGATIGDTAALRLNVWNVPFAVNSGKPAIFTGHIFGNNYYQNSGSSITEHCDVYFSSNVTITGNLTVSATTFSTGVDVSTGAFKRINFGDGTTMITAASGTGSSGSLWRADAGGNLYPSSDPALDTYWEIDAGGNIRPKN